MKFDAAAVARATGGELVRDAEAGPISTDTRTQEKGDWFLALVGPRFDGHDYLVAAQQAGAVGCIVERAPGSEWRGGVVVVEDTTRALQDLGRYARSRVTCPVVGLTGSSGKTTTRALVACALSPMGEIHQTVGNLNNHLGVPMTLVAAPPSAAALVVEMGTSGPGEIEFLARLGEPDVRLIVNVGPAHLEELGGLDGVAVEKGSMFRTARPGDTCCVNIEDGRVAAVPLPDGVRRITFGQGGDISLEQVRIVVDGLTLTTHATYDTPEGRIEASIPAAGRHVALNAAGALAIAAALGVDLHEAAAALADYAPVGMRMKPERLSTGAVVLNDAYNANPQSMKASLDVLGLMQGRRAAVLGDMYELGAEEAAWHQEVLAHAASVGLDRLWLLGSRMAAAAEAAVGIEARALTDAAAVTEELQAWLAPGDVVLLKGSRGARVEQVLQGLRGDAPTGAS